MVRITKAYLKSIFAEKRNPSTLVKDYFVSLLPIIDWLPRYNKIWFFGDLLCGITVGLVAIPQALAHAQLAGLPVQFGLYTSFIGVLAYAIFATSKDVTIGTTAVLSMLTGQLLSTYNTTGIDPVTFATALAFLSGLIQAAIGLLRLGIIIDLISVPVVVGFTSGAALQIIFGQIPGLMGIPGINTNDAPYLVLVTTLKALNKTKLDSAFGFTSIFVLVAFRIVAHYGIKRGHKYFVWIGHSANIAVLAIFTAISFAVYHATPSKSIPIKLVGTVPQGLTYLQVPKVSLFPQLYSPAFSVVLVGIIEHIAMTKAFGRVNGYRADPNQEITALGFTNIIGPFLGAYPATGSLSRSSIKSRSGVKTPLAGLFTGIVVILSIYFVTPLFKFVPSAALSGIIIVSITDLIARPRVVKQLWDIDFFDFLSFLVAFLVTVFVSIEVGIYASVGFSLVVLLYRIARPQLQLLVREESGGWVSYDEVLRETQESKIDSMPFPGIAVFRIEEALTYPNANYLAEKIKRWVQSNTECGSNTKAHDLLWNEKQPDRLFQSSALVDDDSFGIASSRDYRFKKNVLRALVFDLSAVNHIDATGLQILLDARADVESWAGERVPFFFAHVHPEVRQIIEYFCLLPENREMTSVANNHSNPVPDTENQGNDIEFKRREIFGDDKAYLEFLIHRSIDDAVATAQNAFHFGSMSSATVAQV